MRIDAHVALPRTFAPALAAAAPTAARAPAHVPTRAPTATLTPAPAPAGPAANKAGPAPTSRRLAMPPLNQFALQRTWYEARWRPALALAKGRLARTQGGAALLGALTAAIDRASEPGLPASGAPRRAVQAAHRRLVAALAKAGAPRAELRALDRHLVSFLSYWQQSGRAACALAVEKLQAISGATDTNFGKVISGFTKQDARLTPWYQTLSTTPGVPARPKLYKNRKVTYSLTYDTARLRQAAATILGKLNTGQPVHVRVLTGFLHADAGPGRPPQSTHSLAITGYQIEKSVGGQPVRIALEFLDPDGGGKGRLVLDIERQSFQHVPANVGWVDTGADGWDYDSFMPPHRYQVMSIR